MANAVKAPKATKSKKAPATKAPAKSKRATLPKLGTKITDPAFRKKIVRSVKGTAGKKLKEGNRMHNLTYTKGDKTVLEIAQHMGPTECMVHTAKDVIELENSKGTVYYFRKLK